MNWKYFYVSINGVNKNDYFNFMSIQKGGLKYTFLERRLAYEARQATYILNCFEEFTRARYE
jgi:hypothetical protein